MKNIKTYEEYKGRTFEEYLANIENFNDPAINCGYENLIDLDGIDIFDNMTELWCDNNKLKSLTPLKNLPKLKYICCNNNKLKSLESLENLINLNHISCANNKITTLKDIENLINLKGLSCVNNKITSLKPILNFNKLKYLNCRVNPIDWVDYIDKQGRTYYIKLPKSIEILESDKFNTIGKYWKWFDENQPASVSRKFNF